MESDPKPIATETMEQNKMHLLYDDQCKFCCAIALWAKKQNTDFEVWSVRSSESKVLLKSHGINFIDLQTVYFVEGAVHVRSRAAFQLLRHTRRPWRWLSLFRFLPLPLTDFVYNLIAKNRYRWN
jgi:predicted DCC family thiol-disulfide oxidoreductase YuxK